MENKNNINDLNFLEISNHFYDAIYISDGEGKTLYVNDAYTRVTGIPKSAVIGKYVRDLDGKIYKGAVTEKVLKSKKVETSLGNSLINGNELLVTGVPIFNEKGDIKYVVVNNRDISELKRMENEISELNFEFEKAKQHLDYIKSKDEINWDIFKLSPYMQTILSLLDKIGTTDIPVLIQGGVGIGKSRMAKYVHEKSSRKRKGLVEIVCDKKLKFSDIAQKKSNKLSILDLVNTGSLILQHVENLSLEAQEELSDFLEKKEGKYKYQDSYYDIRFLFTSRDDLDVRVKEGLFLEKLYHQIGLLTVNIIPLRERIQDIDWLAAEFLTSFNKKYDKNIELSEEILGIFREYAWPGNVRELENLIERLVIISTDIISKTDVESLISTTVFDMGVSIKNDLKSMLEDYEKTIITKVLQECGNVNQAAKYLGVSQPALWKKCKKWDIKT